MDILAIASVGMQRDLARMDSISHNVANVLTPGFKRQVAIADAFDVQMSGAVANAQRTARVAIDPSAGPMRYTGNAQDVSVEGDGFFEVATPQGPAYTRHGSLHVDVQGRLAVANGMPLMSTSGEFRLANAPFTISANGDVMQDGRLAGRLKLVSFDNSAELVAAGAGLYRTGGALPQEHRYGGTLRVGFVEGANVSTPQEMVRLTETVRHFESLQKLVQGYDDTLEKTIRKLGDF